MGRRFSWCSRHSRDDGDAAHPRTIGIRSSSMKHSSNDAFVDSRLMVICQYNHQLALSPSVLREALRTHPTCILDSRIRDSLDDEPFVTESSKRTSL